MQPPLHPIYLQFISLDPRLGGLVEELPRLLTQRWMEARKKDIKARPGNGHGGIVLESLVRHRLTPSWPCPGGRPGTCVRPALARGPSWLRAVLRRGFRSGHRVSELSRWRRWTPQTAAPP